MTPVAREEALLQKGALMLADNKQYLQRVNQVALQNAVRRPTSTVVLTQDPPPGTQVPIGTQINLTLVAKEDIPTQVLGVNEILVNVWPRTGDVEKAIDKSATVKAILDKNIEYDSLPPVDKNVMDTFMREELKNQDFDAASVYADMNFINGL